ncbi:uncharacterized protein TNCV_887281 [Trichonephila clavipes]|uniref:Uncharacterized protein n=1 Tax=Trichonephila clavipes TaxID=2585209 RepID=A0A8X6RGI9_TRICX|nr:uncharacterized protein TNCV_887281 [Trichonephila clavipes]
MTGTLPPLLDSVVDGGTPGRSFLRVFMDPMLLCPGKGLVLPKTHIDETATHVRFLLLSLPNNAMSQKSPFAIQKALIAIGGKPKSVKRLRSGDLLIETISALHTKSFLLAKTFLDSPVSVSPHKSLNTCHGVLSEPDLLTIPHVEILYGFSGQAVIQARRITKKDSTVIPTKHLILTFNTPNLPTTIKAGYLNSRKLIAPPISQSYAQATKSSKVSATTQTDENITKIKCPPLKLLQQPSSFLKPDIYPSIPSTSSSSTQADLLTSTSPIADISESEPVNPIPNNVSSTSNISAFPSNFDV